MKVIVAMLSMVGLSLLGSGCVVGAASDEEQAVREEQIVSEEQAVSEDGAVASVSEPYCRTSCRTVCGWSWGRWSCRKVCSGGCGRWYRPGYRRW
jgi:hypothetical protein